MTRTLQRQNTGDLRSSGGDVLHVRFGGNSFDISLPGLDIGPASTDGQVKRAVAGFLDVPSYRLDDYVIDRHANGNLTVRPQAEAAVSWRG